MTRWAMLHAIVVAGFLATVATYYHRGEGFTVFIRLPADVGGYLLPAVRETPHAADTGGGYDGQFYAQLAIDPLLRTPAIDRAMDNPSYRARRILFSWTAFALGLGKPAWILHAYALQNVVVWLVLAWLLLRWFPVGSARSFVLWSGCLLAHGLLASVQNALLDGPSALLIACAVVAAEADRPWLLSAILGVSALGRETNVLAGSMLAGFLRRSWRSWATVAMCAAVCLLPLLLWLDYLRSIYHLIPWTSEGNITTPLAGLAWKWRVTRHALGQTFSIAAVCNLLVIVGFVAQVVYTAWAAASRRALTPWLSVAMAFALLGLCVDRVVWEGTPGAITRVVLPLTIGFNVLARDAQWPVIAVGNLGVIPGLAAFVFRTI